MGLMDVIRKTFGRAGIGQQNICGGYSSKVEHTRPVENIKGQVCVFSYHFGDEAGEFRIVDCKLSEKLHIDINKDFQYETYSTDVELTKKVTEKMNYFAVGFAAFNGWNVHVNGLPICGECSCELEFDSKEKAYFCFNGGHAPAEWNKLHDEFTGWLEEVSGYSIDKCVKRKPYVSPYIGEHRFYAEKNGKHEEYRVNVVQGSSEGVNCIFEASGDLGNVKIRCAANKVYGGKLGEFYISMVDYCEDSPQKKPFKKGHLMGILGYNKDSKIMKLVPTVMISFGQDEAYERNFEGPAKEIQ